MSKVVIVNLTQEMILRGELHHQNFLNLFMDMNPNIFQKSLLENNKFKTMKYYEDTGLSDNNFISNLEKEYEIIYVLTYNPKILKKNIAYKKFLLKGVKNGLYLYHYIV